MGRRLTRNTIIRASSEVLGKLASVVLFAYVARKLGSATLGDFVFALALSQIVWAVAGFGLDRMVLRDVARDHGATERIFADMSAFKLAGGLLGLVACVGLVALFGADHRTVVLVALLTGSVVLTLVASGAMAVFQAHERMEYFLYAAVPNKVLAALFGIGALAAGGGIVAVAIGNLAAAVIGLGIALALLYARFARPSLRVRPRGWPRLARTAAPFGLQEVFGQIVFRIDTVLLAALATSAVVGSYGAGYRLLEATLFLSWSVGNSVLPMFSYLDASAVGADPPLHRAYGGALKLLAVVLLPVAVVIGVCARPIVDLVYGLPQYDGTVGVLRWLAPAIVCYGIGHLAGILVLVRRRGRLTVAATAAMAAFNIALNLVLIPPFGAQGAAAATLATEAALALAVVVLARPVAGWPDLRALAGPLTAAGAMAAAMLPVAGRLELALPLGALAYLVALGATELAGGRRAGRITGLLRGGLPVERGNGGGGLPEPEAARPLATAPAQRVGR
jgi:O-antigen/teichoic acid export membrane protein